MSVDQFLLSADTTDLNYPEIRPTLDLNFARTKVLDPRITFTRSSGGSYVGADGLIKYAGVNEPRFEYDLETGESLGLLIEEGRTNLVVGPGSSFGYLFSGNLNPLENDVSPDGKIVPCKYNLIGAIQPFLNVRIPALSAGTYTMSMWIKLDIDNYFANFSVVAEPQSEIYATLIKLTTSWKRYFFTFTLLNNIPGGRLQLFFSNEGENRKVSIWGAQLESGGFASSYIPRQENQQSTRASDNASITGKNFSDFYNPRQDEGTIFTNAKTFAVLGGGGDAVFVGDINTNPVGAAYIDIIRYQPTLRSIMNISNTVSTSTIVSNLSSGKYYKSVHAFKPRNSILVVDGSIIGINNSVSAIPSGLNSLEIGKHKNGFYLNGTINRLTYWPKQLSNEQLIALTR